MKNRLVAILVALIVAVVAIPFVVGDRRVSEKASEKIRGLEIEVSNLERENRELSVQNERLAHSGPECLVTSLNQRLDFVEANPNFSGRGEEFSHRFIEDLVTAKDMGANQKDLSSLEDREIALAGQGYYLSSDEKTAVELRGLWELRDSRYDLIGVRRKK
jgi:hypothetical protein